MENNEGYILPLNEFYAAFQEVFIDETLEWLEYEPQEGRIVLTIASDMMTRTYEVTNDTNFTEMFKNTLKLG